MTQTIELPIHEKNGKQYCEDCKPTKNARRSTLVVSSYDHYCAGCGQSFRDIAEDLVEQEIWGALQGVREGLASEESDAETFGFPWETCLKSIAIAKRNMREA